MSGGFDIGTPYFSPQIRFISNITKGSTTIITTDEDHGYQDGQVVRVIVPTDLNTAYTPTGVAGMTQINGLYAEITVIDSTSFSMPIDSSSFDDFSIPGTWPEVISTYPQIVPMGIDVTIDSSNDAVINEK